MRLESFLFTKEAMEAARDHLNPGGAFSMYNFYREPWLLDRLAGGLQEVYGHRAVPRPRRRRARSQVGTFSMLTVGHDAGGHGVPDDVGRRVARSSRRRPTTGRSST